MRNIMESLYLGILVALIRERGDIPAVRVSSAQARGAAKKYSYWGAARYVVTLTRDGVPTLRAVERADSDRRSVAGAERDAAALAAAEHRIVVHGIGRVTDYEAKGILRQCLTHRVEVTS